MEMPPRPPLAFRVGVVGHRPDRLDLEKLDTLREVIHEILQAVRSEVEMVGEACRTLYSSDPFTLRAVTPLAEGTDRVFGEVALGLGYELTCVMPFPQAEFERDFAPGRALEAGSLERFRGILDRARRETALTTFELDGCRDDEAAAYGAGGRVVLNQSDLLVVVWDGHQRGKRGGTEETFGEAKRTGVGAVWIDAHNPRAWQLVDATTPAPSKRRDQRATPNGSGTAAALRSWVRESLEVPQAVSTGKQAEDPRANLLRYYDERRPAHTRAFVWNVFRDVLGDGKWKGIRNAIRPFEQDVMDEWPPDRSTPIGCVVDSLRPYFAWPDKLAVLHSNRYRSAFVTAFACAALAVFFALLPLCYPLLRVLPFRLPEFPYGDFTAILELGTIGAILYLVLKGRHQRWHERWIDYRLAAELVRHLRLVAPLGGGRPFPQVPAHWTTYGHPGSTWMAWYVRAVERALGLPTAVVDKAYLDLYLRHLSDLLGGKYGQIAYHKITGRRSHKIESRLHAYGIGLLVLTLFACGAHILHGFEELMHLNGRSAPHWFELALKALPSPILTFVCGFLPALGAAMQGVVNQGEFRRIAKHSESMQIHLKNLSNQIEELREELAATNDPISFQFSTPVAALAGDASRLLITEVLDWRVVFLDHPLNPPA